MNNFSQVWLRGKEEGSHDHIRDVFNASTNFRKLLSELLQSKVLEKREASEADNYDCVNWELKQADRVGYIRALKDIEKIIK